MSGLALSVNSDTDPTDPIVYLNNSICWDHPDRLEILGPVDVSYSDIQSPDPNNPSEPWPSISYEGSNILADPQFCDAFGNNFRLEPISPCIDAGLDLLVPPDNTDIDEDGVIELKIPWDRGRESVRQFDSNDNNAEWVDMGAFEYLPPENCPYDLNGDLSVDIEDLAILLACFGSPALASCAAADLNCDGIVDVADLALLLSEFGTQCSTGFAGGGGYSATELWIMSATIPEILAWWEAGMPPMGGD